MLRFPVNKVIVKNVIAKVQSAAIVGLEGVPVEVEVDCASGHLPSFTIVGLPDKAVEESKERVRSAIKNTGFDFPSKRITVNLAPANLPKEGPSYDLPIALGILTASEQIKANITDCIFMGELSLDGKLRHTNGGLLYALLAKEKNLKKVFLPNVNAKEAAVITDIQVYPTTNLLSLYQHLTELKAMIPHQTVTFEEIIQDENFDFDMKDIKGQERAKRAFEIAAAGSHNILLKGPPGAGKTLLSRTLPSILPKLTLQEAIEVTKIYSISGLLDKDLLVIKRPFRAPHHTTSHIGLIGGGGFPKPGEVSLAHRGVLFLDEFPEFPRQVLEALRQPLEDGVITISRSSARLSFPAKFVLIAAQNPCPCGYLGDPHHECKCTPSQILRYKKRVSGPILDRIDIHLAVPAVKVDKLAEDNKNIRVEDSNKIRARVQKAREMQLKRFEATSILSNSEMSNKDIKRFCQLSNQCLSLLKSAVDKMQLSARSYHRVIKLSRTIADLEQSLSINVVHIAEALQYRPRLG